MKITSPVSFCLSLFAFRLASAEYSPKVYPSANPHAVVTVQVTQEGLNFVIGAVGERLKWQIPGIVFPNQAFGAGGYDITLINVRVDRFIMPDVTFNVQSPALHVTAKGGNVSVSADWSAINVCNGAMSIVTTTAGFDVSFEIRPKTAKSKNNGLAISNCRINAPFRVNTSSCVGRVVNAINGFMQWVFKTQTSWLFCKALSDNVERIFNRPQLRITDHYNLTYDLNAFQLNDKEILVKLSAVMIPNKDAAWW